jgi:hypothetical protein
MRRFQAVIAYTSRSGESDVYDRDPAFEAMVVRAMKPIGDSDRQRCASNLNPREQWVVVDDPIIEKKFLSTTATHIQGRSVIESPGRSYGEE